MSKCNRCKSEITWDRKGVKWIPINPDGTVHWELCKSITRKNEGARVEHFGRKGGSGYVWCGEVAPWDESLGDYRDYMDAEIQAREVCVYRP